MNLIMYRTIMTNFNITKYIGDELIKAIDTAEQCGYECHILRDNEVIGEYSTISGWRK